MKQRVVVHKVDALTSQAQAAQAANLHSETATAAVVEQGRPRV